MRTRNLFGRLSAGHSTECTGHVNNYARKSAKIVSYKSIPETKRISLTCTLIF